MPQEVFRVGPVTIEDGESLFVVGATDGRRRFSADGPTVAEALEALKAKVPLEGSTCSPLLSEWAASFGMRPEPLSEEAAAGAMSLALGLEYELPGESPDEAGVMIELAEVCGEFLDAAPWEQFPPDAPVVIELRGALKRKMWARVSDGGLALFFSEDGPVLFERAAEAEDAEAVRTVEMISLVFDEEPVFLAEAMEEFMGVRAAPQLTRTGGGKIRLPSVSEVAALVAALDAVTAEVSDDGRPGECFSVKASATLRSRPRQPPSPATPVDPYAGVDRNDPCPCGSGRKFKKCHLGAAPAARKAAPTTAPSPWHSVDGKLVRRMLDAADSLLGPGWRAHAMSTLFAQREVRDALLVPYVAFEHGFAGRTLVDRFLETKPSLSEEERRWIAVNRKARVAICEVLEVEPGRGARVVDLLSGRPFFLSDRGLAQVILPRLSVLARLVEIDGEVLAVGSHPQPLEPEDADAAVERLRKETDRSLPLATRVWDEEISRVALRAASPMKVTNTDGDPLLFVEQRFTFDRSRRDEVLSALLRIEGCVDQGEEKGARLFGVERPGNRLHPTWRATQVAAIQVEKKGLVVSTNSTARADAIERRLLEVVPFLAAKGRQETKPPEGKGGRELSFDIQGFALGPGGTALAGRAMSLAFLDAPLPELDGRTPRAAVKTSEGRAKVHRLLRMMEHGDARAKDGMEGTVPATELRAMLGLDELGEVDPHHALRAAIGFGRKASDTLVEFAQDAIEALRPSSERETLQLFEHAIAIWNAAVLETEVREVPKDVLDSTRAAEKLIQKSSGAQAAAFDALRERKRTVFAADRRLFAYPQVDGARFAVMSLVPEPYASRMRAAGLRIAGQVG